MLLLLSILFLCFFNKLTQTPYLTFSDSAKYADLARNIATGRGYGVSYSTFSNALLNLTKDNLFSAYWMSPLMSFAFLASFKALGISDLSVITTSSIFYLGIVTMVYLIGNKLFGRLVGFLSAVAVAANVNFLDYATTGATETLFVFGLLLVFYLFILNNKWTNLFGFLSFIPIYLARPHAPIYLIVLLAFFLYLNLKDNRYIYLKIVFIVVSTILIYEIAARLFGDKLFLVSIFNRGLISSLHYSTIAPSNVALRETLIDPRALFLANIGIMIKKFLYNMYNFYKLLPEIASPYLWALFIIGLFKSNKNRLINSSKLTVLFMVAIVFIVNAITIPFYRYLHPTVPFVYIFAVATLVWIVEKMIDSKVSIFSYLKKTYSGLKKGHLTTGISTFLIFFFVVGQTLGVIFLDSRFKVARTNKGKPPAYVRLSWLLRDNTGLDDVVITNLDTWGSWYGERKTIWFPLKPEQLNLKDDKEIPFDAIYLTSYLIDDENYYMGEEWRQIFYNPENLENEFIADNFELKDVYQVSAEETYERQDARAVLLVRKEH